MTPERALEIIKDELTIESGIINEALKIVENAIEKQVPKKSKGIFDANECFKSDEFSFYERALIGKCPNCNHEVQEGMNFCMKCGQAIDWSDNSEIG